MREIEFRGKAVIGNKWVYGWLNATKGSLKNNYYWIDVDEDSYKVDPETIGQYTGLKDKNGKKIFEGDIVEVFAERNVYNRKQSIKDKYIKVRGLIEFGKNTFHGHGFNINYQNKYNNKLCEPVGKETCQRTLSHWDLGFYAEKHNYHVMWKFKEEIKVIGNIYDNPELLEVEK